MKYISGIIAIQCHFLYIYFSKAVTEKSHLLVSSLEPVNHFNSWPEPRILCSTHQQYSWAASHPSLKSHDMPLSFFFFFFNIYLFIWLHQSFVVALGVTGFLLHWMLLRFCCAAVRGVAKNRTWLSDWTASNNWQCDALEDFGFLHIKWETSVTPLSTKEEGFFPDLSL